MADENNPIKPPEIIQARAGNRNTLVAINIEIAQVPNKVVEYVRIPQELVDAIEQFRARGIIGFEYDGTTTLGVILNS
jgi:hypothetical protein